MSHFGRPTYRTVITIDRKTTFAYKGKSSGGAERAFRSAVDIEGTEERHEGVVSLWSDNYPNKWSFAK